MSVELPPELPPIFYDNAGRLRPRIMGTECEYAVQSRASTGDQLNLYTTPLAVAAAGLRIQSQYLNNGGRLYPDVKHLEYATAECLGPRQAAAADLAGVRVVAQVVNRVRDPGQAIYRSAGTYMPSLFTAGLGAETSRGYHESLMTARDVTRRHDIDAVLPGYLASRTWTMGGHLRKGNYVFSQKVWGLGGRVLVRDVPSTRAMAKHKPMCTIPPAASDSDVVGNRDLARVEIRFADPGLSPTNRFMALASLSLVMRLIEHPKRVDMDKLRKYELSDPLEAAVTFASDLTMKQTVETTTGLSVTALDLQEIYADQALKLAEKVGLPDDEVLAATMWRDLCDELRAASPQDCEYGDLIYSLDIAIKHRFLIRRNSAEELARNTPAAANRATSWERTLPTGPAMKWWEGHPSDIVTADEITHLTTNAPDNRAAIRAHYIDKSPRLIRGINWASLWLADQERLIIHNPYETLDEHLAGQVAY